MEKEANITPTNTPEEIIKEQRILDNIMIPVFFEPDSSEAKEALQKFLRILLNDPKLIVERYQPEYVMSNIGHHGIRIDIWARDGHGRQIAIEMQKVTDEEIYFRAAFEGATMVVHSLAAGQPYSCVDKVLVIFFTQKDLEGKGEPLYVYESTLNGKAGKMTQVAPSYLFVNGNYRNDETELGRLIADTVESDPDKIRTSILRNRMNRIKNTKEGREKMGSALERYVAEQTAEAEAEAETRGQRKLLYQLVKDGKLTVDDAAGVARILPDAFERDMRAYEAAQTAVATTSPSQR